jgi:hypothetical protein
MEHNAIVWLSPDLKTRTEIARDGRLLWPDSDSVPRDGSVHQHVAGPRGAAVPRWYRPAHPPFGVSRLKLP